MIRSSLNDFFGLRGRSRQRTHRLAFEPLEERRLLSAYDILASSVAATNDSNVSRYGDISQLPVPGGAAAGTGGLGQAEGVAAAPDGSYFVSSGATAQVLHFSNSGQSLGTLGGVTFGKPAALTFGPNGNLYVADTQAGVIYQFQYSVPSATAQFLSAGTITLPAGFSPGGFTFAQDSTSDPIIGDLTTGKVVRIHGGVSTTLVAGGNIIPVAILALGNGNLLIVDGDQSYDPTDHHQIVEYNASTKAISPFINLTTQPTSLAFDSDDNLLVGLSLDSAGDGSVEKFNIQTAALMSTVASGLGAPSGLALVPSQVSDLLVGVLDSVDGQSVERYNTATNSLVAGGAPVDGVNNIGYTSGVAVAPDGSYYVSTLALHYVLHYSNSGTYLDSVGSNYLAEPGTLAFGPNGNLYVADLHLDVIYQFDLNTSTQVPVATLTLPTNFTPGGFTFADNATRDLIVGDINTDTNSGEILQYYNFAAGAYYSPPLVSSGQNIVPDALLALSNGNLLIANSVPYGGDPNSNHDILEYNAATQSLTQLIDLTASSGNPPQPTSLSLAADGNLLVGSSPDEMPTSGIVEEFNLTTGAPIATLLTSIGPPAGLAYVPPVAMGGAGGQMAVPSSDWTSAGLTIGSDGNGNLVAYPSNGTPTNAVASQPVNAVAGTSVVGANNATNALTIDFSNGYPIPPDGISFSGGMGSATNSVIVRDPAATAAYTLNSSLLHLTNVPTVNLNLGKGNFDVSDLSSSVNIVTMSSGNFIVCNGKVNAKLSGPGRLEKSGSGTATLAGTNGYQGGTIVTDGALVVATAASLPDGSSLTVGDASAFSGVLTQSRPSAAQASTAATFLVAAPLAASTVTANRIAGQETPAASVAVPSSRVAEAVWNRYNDLDFARPSAAGYVSWLNRAAATSNFQEKPLSDRLAAVDAIMAEYGAA